MASNGKIEEVKRLQQERLHGRFTVLDGQCFATRILRCGIHMNMGCAHRIELFLDDVPGQFRAIAIAAQVPEVHMLQIGRDQVGEEIGCRVVAEMAVAAHDPLLHAPGAADIVLKQFHIMVRFQHEDVGGPDAFHDQLCRVAEIGEETDSASARPQHKADWVISIVRHGKCFNSDRTNLEHCAGAEHAKIESGRLELKCDRFFREAIAKDRHGNLVAQGTEAVGMVGMLVGEENSGEAFRRPANLREPLANLLGAEPGVDQEPRIAGFEIRAITIRTAAQDRELNGH